MVLHWPEYLCNICLVIQMCTYVMFTFCRNKVKVEWMEIFLLYTRLDFIVGQSLWSELSEW